MQIQCFFCKRFRCWFVRENYLLRPFASVLLRILMMRDFVLCSDGRPATDPVCLNISNCRTVFQCGKFGAMKILLNLPPPQGAVYLYYGRLGCDAVYFERNLHHLTNYMTYIARRTSDVRYYLPVILYRA
jgi:hypothetical protein